MNELDIIKKLCEELKEKETEIYFLKERLKMVEATEDREGHAK